MAGYQEQILNVLNEAIVTFNSNERYLMINDLSERCICSKFASYLERAINKSSFKDYVVDVEYNRGYGGCDHNIKMLFGSRIFVDLIVHKRGYDNLLGFDNLICIEMKKANNTSSLAKDKERLKALTDTSNGYDYKAGFMLVIRENALEIEELFLNRNYLNA